MSQIKQLYALQEIDLELDKKRENLSQVESQMGESQACKQAQDDLERERKQLAELEKNQKELGWQLDSLQAKISQSNEKLYGGSIKNPRELTSLQEEIAQVRAKQSQTEDKLLEVMIQIESVQEKTKSLTKEWQQLQAEWQQSQQQLANQQSQLQADIEQLDEKRRNLIDILPPAITELYETLRHAKQGRAVAKVEQGRCQGCRLALSVTDLRRARAGSDLVYCSSCGRILYSD